jgi:hypothetical protein
MGNLLSLVLPPCWVSELAPQLGKHKFWKEFNVAKILKMVEKGYKLFL